MKLLCGKHVELPGESENCRNMGRRVASGAFGAIHDVPQRRGAGGGSFAGKGLSTLTLSVIKRINPEKNTDLNRPAGDRNKLYDASTEMFCLDALRHAPNVAEVRRGKIGQI